MSKLLLPASLNPISRRRDKSVKLSFETRELSSEEILTALTFEGTEGWLLFSQNPVQKEEIDNIPQTNDLDKKSHSSRLRSVLFLIWKQETVDGYVGSFDTYYSDTLEKIITHYKKRIND